MKISSMVLAAFSLLAAELSPAATSDAAAGVGVALGRSDASPITRLAASPETRSSALPTTRLAASDETRSSASPGTAYARADTVPVDPAHPDRPWPPIATFSILAYDSVTGEIGGAVQSRVFSVGNGVLWAKAGVGAVATQAIVDVSYGPKGLELLKQGMAPADIVKKLWDDDTDPLPERWSKYGRQFAVIDAQGHVAAYTGPQAPEWAGDRQCTKPGTHCTAQGNILAGDTVVDAMVHAFENTEGLLRFRLLAALEAGQKAGGDKRGMESAAMLIVKKNGGVWLHNDVVLRLQVDDSPEPIKELRRLVEKAPVIRRPMGGGNGR